jgi:hypothetical protein
LKWSKTIHALNVFEGRERKREKKEKGLSVKYLRRERETELL